MSKEIYISSTPQETRLAIVEKEELTEIYYERENEYTLAGSIYNGKVTRVLPGMQSSFVDIGLERDAFLYITDFMEEAGDSADFEGGPRREPRSENRPSENRPSEARSSEGRGDRGGRARRERSSEEPRRTSEDNPAPAAHDDQGEDVGEGAPGADGSRRWRGRRGRRRGRSDEGESITSTAPGTSEPTIVVGSEGFDDELPGESRASRETRAPRENHAPRESRESRETRSAEPEASRPERIEGRGDRESRGDRGGRGRRDGRREGRGGGGETRSAEPRNSAEPRSSDSPSEDRGRRNGIRDRFAPRGARPGGRDEETVDLHAADAGPQPEPFILPGESLSKYRRGEDGQPEPSAARPEPAAPARPSTEVAPLTGWDGGSVLPGETLSRHRGGETRGESRTDSREDHAPREDRGNSGDGRNRRRDRDTERGRGGSGDSRSRERKLDPSIAVQPAVTSQHEPEGAMLPLTDDAPAFQTYETEERLEATHHQEEAHAEFIAQRLEVQEQLDQVDPVWEPSTATVAEFAEKPAELVVEAVEELHETVAEYEPGDDASASFRIDTGATREFRQSAPVDHVPEESAQPAHEFTSVQPAGDMISDAIEVEDVHDEAAPIEHERAVQGVHLHESEGTPMQPEGAFAPGDGELEEELLDDEEEGAMNLQASAFDDDTEEETLEVAADLGSMIEDMSLDAIVHNDVDVEEDDEDDDMDFDDEDLEEDELGSGEELAGSDVSETEEGDFAEGSEFDEEEPAFTEEGEGRPASAEGDRANGERPAGERSGEGRARRDRGGRDRGGRDRAGRDRGSDRGARERSSGGGFRDKRGMSASRSGGRMSRASAQLSDLPAISDLLKPGQEVLVQIAKEPIAKKGARITSHIALPGRFLVFMPTVSHIGVSRKIESDGERRRLKEILLSERGEASGGFIVRTAASGASEEELRSDLRFLLNLWTDIKTRSESSKSPALIYHDLNLIERILRDQVTDNFSAIWVDTESEYERVLRFLQRFQPSLIRRVKLYSKETPLFEQFGITEEINKALRSKVWLKSGGSIVINQTEALVAIDINTGKFVGKTARLEDTIVKTNLDSIPEIVRQIRLRDLGGIIVIDFIDMDERKNRNKVLQALEDELKKDRAPSKVLQFNDFGLVAITRKRVKQSLERTLSTTCGICAGTGMVKSPITVCNDIYVELRKMHKHIEKQDVMLRVNPEVVKQLKLNGGKWLQEMEEMSRKTILVKSDPGLHPEQFDLH
jgi:ribonuclease E